MRTFRYLPPGTEEQRAFVMQFLGVLLGAIVACVLSFRAADDRIKMILWGAVAGTIYLLVRSAWQLENKARRSQFASVGFDSDELLLIDQNGIEQRLGWKEITGCEVQGGKLHLSWPAGALEISAREIEDGMTFIGEVVRRYQGKSDFAPPTNFIPLAPK